MTPSDQLKSTFFNVIMKSADTNHVSLGLHLSGGAGKEPFCIRNVDKGSLSEACGLRVGDVVDMVNGTKIASLSSQQVQNLINSNKEKIHLQIRRNNNMKNKVSYKDYSEDDPSCSNLSKSSSTECHISRKKSKERGCGSFVNRIFRSRSQDQCKNGSSSMQGSTLRSSSLIVHLSHNALSSSQNTLKKPNRLSSCIKRFKHKDVTKNQPEIDVSVVSPNNAYHHSLSRDSTSTQERFEISMPTTPTNTVPISLNVINSQASQKPPSSSRTIVNISPTLKILDINTLDSKPVSKSSNCSILNYTDPQTSVNESKSKSQFNKEIKSNLKYTLPSTHFRFDNVSSTNTNVNCKVSDQKRIESEINRTPMTNIQNSFYSLPQKPDNTNCYTQSSVVNSPSNAEKPLFKEVKERFEIENNVESKLVLKSTETTDDIPIINREGKRPLPQSDMGVTLKNGPNKQKFLLETEIISNEDLPLVPPKRHLKNVIPSENILHITKTRTTTIISSNSPIKSTSFIKDNVITTTAPIDYTRSNDVSGMGGLRMIQNSGEIEKAALDKILDDALLDLNADAKISKTMPHSSNQQTAMSSAQNNLKTGRENISFDVYKHDDKTTTQTSSSVYDNSERTTYISKAEITKHDHNEDNANKNDFITNESLVLYSINDGSSDVGSAIKSPDSGISSNLSPSDLNERLQEQNVFKNTNYISSQSHTNSSVNNVNVVYGDTSTTCNESTDEMIRKDKKLINVVSPTSLKEDLIRNIPLVSTFNSNRILRQKSEDLVGTFDEFNTFNNKIVRSELVINPSSNMTPNTVELDSIKEQLDFNQNPHQTTKFKYELGKPIIKPPSYNSVLYSEESNQQTALTSPSPYDCPNITSVTISSRNNHFQDAKTFNKDSLISSNQDYDNLKTMGMKSADLNVSHTHDGIYEQIPAFNGHYFAKKEDSITRNNTQFEYPNQKQENYVNGQRISDGTDQDVRQNHFLKNQLKEGERQRELQRNEVMDELKHALIGGMSSSEPFYNTTAPQSFTPINQNPSSQCSYTDLSIRNLAINPNRNASYEEYRGANMGEEELENEHIMEHMAQIEQHRILIKGIHKARNSQPAYNESERMVSPNHMVYANIEKPSRTRMTKYRGKARVLHNFRARKPVELSLRKGDVVFLLRKVDRNWVEGEHHNLTGIFPMSYVEVLESLEDAHAVARTKEGSATVLHDFITRSSLELPLKKGNVVTLVRRIDENWYEGRFGNKRGIFPSSYVASMREPDTPLPTPCVSRMTTPKPGWQSPSAASIFSIDLPSACPSEFNVDLSRGSSPMGGSILEGYLPGMQSLPRPFSAMSAPVYARNLTPQLSYGGNQFSYGQNNRNYDARTLNYGRNANTSVLRQPLYSASMIREELAELGPKESSSTMSRMTKLYNNNQFNNVSHQNKLNYQLENRQTHPYFRKVEISDAQDTRNTPSNPMRKQQYESRQQATFQDNQTRQGKYSSKKIEQRGVLKLNPKQLIAPSFERGVDISAKSVKYPRYHALHTFEARNSEEISLNKNDVVRVVERCSDGWFIGFVESTRKFGMFPGNYVEIAKNL